MQLKEIIEGFLLELDIRGESKKTIRSYTNSLKIFAKGVATSMSKTKTNVMQDAITMYNQSKKSFYSLAQAGRSSFSNLYNGVTTSS